MIEKLDQWYEIGMDGDIYFEGRLLFRADAASFNTIGFGFAKDEQYVYYKGEILNHADPATFSVDPKTGHGSDINGFRIFDSFAGGPTPVYRILPLKGFQNAFGKKLLLSTPYWDVIEQIGYPWQPTFAPLSVENKAPSFLHSADFRHLGFTAYFDEEARLSRVCFKPDYEHAMGCRVILKKRDFFRLPLHSLKSLKKLGFKEQKEGRSEGPFFFENPHMGIDISLKTGEALNQPSGVEIFPAKQLFVYHLHLHATRYLNQQAQVGSH